MSKPSHQSSHSYLQNSSTPFKMNSSILNNTPLNPINSNVKPPQSINSTPKSHSRFQTNHSISNSDSMLNLTNFCLHQSVPTIYPASLLHHPHLDDLLTIHPSKLTLKESSNHFITCPKRSNSSNSVPSKSQKLFQTDSQTTQSPFQNFSQSIASTSPSRIPSIPKHYPSLIITILQ
ncbi:hypothetical protein O181_086100 [Austropuccinia psidii MF-1]|uniref:Uncharacterized protein n=1 Tax=Austropuccinia psidii MF-1 TaxID=1389203 RepID=A0A9Q3IN58_9BASI|nr:hypothetical protein [Austropuccinia psidii MF-1]